MYFLYVGQRGVILHNTHSLSISDKVQAVLTRYEVIHYLQNMNPYKVKTSRMIVYVSRSGGEKGKCTVN